MQYEQYVFFAAWNEKEMWYKSFLMHVNVFKNCSAKTATFSVLQLGIHSNMNLCLVMQKQHRGSILGRNGDKNLNGLLLHAIHSHLHQMI
jgi:hypothetical protein